MRTTHDLLPKIVIIAILAALLFPLLGWAKARGFWWLPLVLGLGIVGAFGLLDYLRSPRRIQRRGRKRQ